jgi:hypothetical protein
VLGFGALGFSVIVPKVFLLFPEATWKELSEIDVDAVADFRLRS